MSEADELIEPVAAGKAVARLDPAPGADAWADLRPAVRWVQRRAVLLGAIALVVAQVAWRAWFLSGMYFLREDFFNLDLARRSQLSWSYLTYIGTGHLMIGERAIVWVVARVGIYNWGLAAGISLAFVAAAGLAALAMLRTLFGERPSILVPLAIYLLAPLTLADLGWWTAALESFPLQFAMFMAIRSHVQYVRSGGRRDLAAAVGWVAIGLVFFEKGIVVPVLLFALTAGFLAGGGSLRRGARAVLVRYRAAWVLYAVLAGVYAVLLATALKTSTTAPQAPSTLAVAVTFAWNLLSKTLLPAAIGGPWQWLPLPGGWYALAAVPAGLAWLPVVVAILVVAASAIRRWTAWRAWAILLTWVLVADIAPVVISRLTWYPGLVALDTRYVADATPVLALCVGLAFMPLSRPAGEGVAAADAGAGASRVTWPGGWTVGDQRWRAAATALFAVFVVGSVASCQAYAHVTTGEQAASYIANAALAIRLTPRGTQVVDSGLPGEVTFTGDARASRVVGDLSPGWFRWLSVPDGSFDTLRTFGPDGRLHYAGVFGMGSVRRPDGKNCWAATAGRITVPFAAATPAGSTVVRVGYLWYSTSPLAVTVRYGSQVRRADLEPGLHGLYLPVRGSASEVTIGGYGLQAPCVGDAEAGNLLPTLSGPTIPPVTFGGTAIGRPSPGIGASTPLRRRSR